MRATDFLNEFSKAQDAFRWECLDDGSIRGVLRSGSVRTAFDPVTAVLFLRDSTGSLETDRVRAAAQLTLSSPEGSAILDAADGKVWSHVDGQMVLDGYRNWLREEILGLTGLELDETVQQGAATVPDRANGTSLEPEHQLQHS